MLEQKLAKHISEGRLTVRGLGATDRAFGGLDSKRPWLDVAVRVKDRATAWKLALNPDLYFGEAYMNGDLTIEKGSLRDLLTLCLINFQTDARRLPEGRLRRFVSRAIKPFQQMNSRVASRRNVAHHYDLSDDLYGWFLDSDRQYSCAYFEHPNATLEEAQRAKKAHIIAKLRIEPGQRVLDIGCGWGGLALEIAKRGAGSVMGITLSSEQLSVARSRAAAAGLDRRVTFELQDYRDLQGPFDRIVSVGMFEHVGTPQYRTFFDGVSRLLADEGVALLHSIGSMDGPGATSAWIRKYIFPGGYIPALSEVMPVIERAGLWVTDIEILRLHYAETLRHWQARFSSNRAEIAEPMMRDFAECGSSIWRSARWRSATIS
jgi:cyclopropane-fatty-acyl-phospholipid synthase